MDVISFINKTLALGTIMSQIFVLLAIIYLLFLRKKYPAIQKFFSDHLLLFSFIIAVIATLSSLFYSKIAGFPPCELCWYQRIFMYPLVILFGLALIKKDLSIVRYATPLFVVGFLISLYHNYIYYFNQGLNTQCQILANSVSCVKRYVFEFGYITIPIMALTAFSLLIIFLIFYKLQNVQKSE